MMETFSASSATLMNLINEHPNWIGKRPMSHVLGRRMVIKSTPSDGAIARQCEPIGFERPGRYRAFGR